MELCTYKRGLWSCVQPRRESNSKTVALFCDRHFNNANRKSKRKTEKKKAMTMTTDAHEKYLARVNSQSRERNRAYRSRRRESLDSIVDERVIAIASRLDTIKDGKHYVIIPNVVSDLLTVDDVVREGDIEPIDFTNATGPVTRTMQAVQNGKDIMPEVLEALRAVFPDCTKIEVNIIRSESGDTPQLTHCDFAPTHHAKRIQNLKGFHYSAIIALQNGTHLLVGEENKSIHIPRSSMMFFRGDMDHAGDGYHEVNERLFISISSHAFPASEDVLLNLP